MNKSDNELIAEFMSLAPSGFTRGDDLDPIYKKGDFVQTGWAGLHRSELKYDTSWDWLMPVVRKIITMTSATNIGDFDIKDRYQAVMLCGTLRKNLTFADINSVCHSVTEFIKWFNQQSNG